MTQSKRKSGKGLFWIGVYVLVKGSLLLVLGIGVLRLVGENIAKLAHDWLRIAGIDLENRIVSTFLAKLSLIRDDQILLTSAITVSCGVVFLVQGIGLLRNKRWAEYLTLVITLGFFPPEVWNIFHNHSAAEWVLLPLNIAITIYVIVSLRR